MSRSSWYHRQRAASEPTRPTRQVHVTPPQCAWCSSRSITRCEFPGCNVALCRRHLVRKGGGNLCRNHRDARLVQVLGVPSAGAIPIAAEMSKRFRPKGPALPWKGVAR